MNNGDSKLLSARAAAAMYGCNERWLLEKARQKKIPHIKLEHQVRFTTGDLDAYFEAHRVDASCG